MKKLLIAALVLMAGPAFAGYDIDNKNIVNDVSTLGIGSVSDNDYIKVYSVTNTTTGYGDAYKIPLAALVNMTEALTATNTLTTADCGKTLLLNSATEFATTLPTPTAGCKLSFVVKAAPSSASYTIVTASSGNVFIGHVESADLDASGDGDVSTADDTITIADGVAVVGDQLEMISDGTSWYYIGHARTYNGITAAQAS